MREYDPRTCDSVVCNDHFTETDTDPQLRLYVIFKLGVGVSIFHLKRKCRGDRVRRPSEFGYQCIASYLPGGATIGLNRFGETSKAGLNTFMRDRFITLDQLRRTDHIGMENDSELTRRTICQRKMLVFRMLGFSEMLPCQFEVGERIQLSITAFPTRFDTSRGVLGTFLSSDILQFRLGSPKASVQPI